MKDKGVTTSMNKGNGADMSGMVVVVVTKAVMRCTMTRQSLFLTIVTTTPLLLHLQLTVPQYTAVTGRLCSDHDRHCLKPRAIIIIIIVVVVVVVV